MSFRSLAQCLLIAAMMCACSPEPWPDPPPVDRAAFLTEHATWRSRVEQRMRDNWVGLTGLWLLSEERTAFGTDSSLPIVLASPGPRRAVGTFLRHGPTVQIEPIGPGLLLSNDNRPYRAIDSPAVLRTDSDSVPTYLRFGSFRLWIHVVDDRDYVRVMDDASPVGGGSPWGRSTSRIRGGVSLHDSTPIGRPRWCASQRLPAMMRR